MCTAGRPIQLRPDGLPNLSGRRDITAAERDVVRRTAFELSRGRAPRNNSELTNFFRVDVTADRHLDRRDRRALFAHAMLSSMKC